MNIEGEMLSKFAFCHVMSYCDLYFMSSSFIFEVAFSKLQL